MSDSLPRGSWRPLPRSPWSRFLLCCFAGIWGLRAYLIERYGASIPQVDEWEAIGMKTLLPWREGTLTLAALFEAHNGDHRIVATRLWEILWFTINGAWEPKLMMILKAGIFAGAATGFIHLLAGWLPRWRFAAGTLLAVLFAFPFSFHNLFWSFQSQFDFFLLTLACGWLALRANRPVLALVCAAVSPFTLGAGPIVAASYLPFAAGAWWVGRWSGRKAAAFGGAALVIFAVGASLRASHAAPLGPPADQAKAFATLVGWPHSGLVSIVDRLPESERLIPKPVIDFPTRDTSWMLRFADWLHAHPAAVPALNITLALMLLAPTLATAVLVWRRRERGLAQWGPLGLAGFALLMMAATAIARSQEPGIIAVRYVDLLALSGFSALGCAFLLAARSATWRRWMVVWGLMTAPSWLATMLGTAMQVKQAKPQLWLENTRLYLPTHDREILRRIVAENPNWPLPFISRDIENLMDMLDDRRLLTVFPESVTQANYQPRPVARTASAIAAQGLWIVVIATVGGAWVVLRSRRQLPLTAAKSKPLSVAPTPLP